MHIKMNTGLSGPLYCLVAGDEIAFDENFPFGARELGRHIAAGNCAYVGEQADLDAWIAANPEPEPEGEPDVDPKPEGEPEADPTIANEPELEAPVTEAPTTPEPAAEPAPAAAPKAPANAAAKKK